MKFSIPFPSSGIKTDRVSVLAVAERALDCAFDVVRVVKGAASRSIGERVHSEEVVRIRGEAPCSWLSRVNAALILRLELRRSHQSASIYWINRHVGLVQCPSRSFNLRTERAVITIWLHQGLGVISDADGEAPRDPDQTLPAWNSRHMIGDGFHRACRGQGSVDVRKITQLSLSRFKKLPKLRRH